MQSPYAGYSKILVTCFGTSDAVAFTVTFFHVFHQIQSGIKIPASLSVLSVTCQQALQKEGIKLPLYEQDLESSCKNAPLEKILVIPLLLEDGKEYQKILAVTERFNQKNTIAVLPPLLHYNAYFVNTVNILFPQVENRCYILVAHGSTFSDNAGFHTLAESLHRSGRFDISFVLLHGTSPLQTFPEAKESVLIPFFLACGHHWQEEKDTLKTEFLKHYPSVSIGKKGIIEMGLLDSLWKELL